MKMKMQMAVIFIGLVLAGCSTMSISNPGYGNSFYRGELQEAEMIGSAAEDKVTQADIMAALSHQGPLVPRRSQSLLLIQSGALVPDQEMQEALRQSFTVGAFSGIPGDKRDDFAKRLRLIAAQGGYRQILCYWGALEAESSGNANKAVSWVPIVGSFIPDEKQRMRIRLKAILIDVETARWRVYEPEPIEDTTVSAAKDRVEAGRDQVDLLKAKGYAALAVLVAQSAEP